MFRCFQTYLHLLTRAGIRDSKNNDVYCKRQTTDLSLQFFKIGNKQMKTVYLAGLLLILMDETDVNVLIAVVARNPYLQVVSMHASHVCSQHHS